MARYTGPKDKLSRREGFDIFGKGAKLTRLAVPPGQHGPKGARRPSEYGRQLREKQKAKRFYGVMERQFKRYVAQAGRTRVNRGEELLRLLEARLDNVVYRLGFAPTRPSARQLVNHGHIFVNQKRVTIPSFSVKVGDVISLSGHAQKHVPAVAKLLSQKPQIVEWLDRQGAVGKIVRFPNREDIPEAINEGTIVEFYSR